MRRDMDLIRELMLKLEDLPYELGSIHTLTPGCGEMAVDGYSPEEIRYHFELLLEGGYLVTAGGNLDGDTYFERLSVAGHDFVDSVRSPAVWA